MKLEDLIAAKVRMAEIDATIVIWIGAVLVLLALGCVALGWWIYRDESHYGDEPAALWFAAVVLLCFGGPCLGRGIYDIKTAEMQARAELAKYQLIELRKQE